MDLSVYLAVCLSGGIDGDEGQKRDWSEVRLKYWVIWTGIIYRLAGLAGHVDE